MSMNLYLVLPRSRATDDSGRTWYDLPVQINTNDSYRMLYENYHHVEKKNVRSHSELRRSTFKRTLNKYKEYMMQRVHRMYPREEWYPGSYHKQFHNEECRWVLDHITELAKLGEEGATWAAG